MTAHSTTEVVMTLCNNCNTQTNNPKFCSRSCSASYNNHKVPKRSLRVKHCALCNTTLSTNRNKFCPNCLLKYRERNIRDCVCLLCDKKYVYTPRSGHSLQQCSSCRANSKRNTKKLRMIAYKGGCCIRCGYNKSPRALHFHHLDSQAKEFTLSNSRVYKWDTLKAELDKCVLVCANCHAELHEEQQIASHSLMEKPRSDIS